jgi:autotransporter family porin
VIYDGLDMGDHDDGLGNTVSGTDSYNITSRAGFRLYGEATSPVNRAQTFRPFFGMNYINNTSRAGVTYNGDSQFSPQGVTNLGEAEVGIEGKVAKNVNVYAKVAQTMGGDGYNSTFGNIGVNATF